MWLNVGCGTHHAPNPWHNVDVVENDTTHPDQIVKSGEPLPFPDGSCDRIFLGHVLEHVRWDRVLSFLDDVRRLLAPDGRLLVAGPDVYRTIAEWHEGRVGWPLVQSVLEHAEIETDWPEASHQWNCHEQRVVDLLTAAGFVNLEAVAVPPAGWPVVNWTGWQFAVTAQKGTP